MVKSQRVQGSLDLVVNRSRYDLQVSVRNETDVIYEDGEDS